MTMCLVATRTQGLKSSPENPDYCLLTADSCHNRNMRILYLHPSIDMKRPAYGVIPVGAFALCSGLQSQDHEVKMLNVALELLLNPTFNLLAFLHQYQPELILVELHWYVHAVGAIKLAKVAKQWKKNVPIVAGGITASIFAHELITYPEFDFILSGDAEYAIQVLVKQLEAPQPQFKGVPNLWFKTDNQVNPPTRHHAETTLDHLDFTNYGLLKDWDRYMQVGKVPAVQHIPGRYPDFWLCNARGCVFQCDFCGGGKVAQGEVYGRKGIVKRSVAKLSADISYLYQNTGLQQVCLSYDLALMKKEYYSQLFADWKTKQWQLGLYNECWQLPTKTFVSAFSESVIIGQSALVFSPISGSEEVRKSNGKFFSNQHFLELLALTAKRQIPVQLFFNFNAYKQDFNAFKETIELCREISQFYPPALLTLYCQEVSPEPLSPRGERLVKLTFQDYYLHQAEQLEKPDEIQLEKESLWQGFLHEQQSLSQPLFQRYNQNIWALSS